ncbi:hypothetical protein E3N88_13807 [Mikania micrantha]|uniref:Reverse transcriptase Ty1/copia-type domain-containing protein n=1 Tax=Mikania micrantha TaxID=192012 RepID=A0A5N6P0V2_9ASTR|nr:hypothetical protein E3N88_13807 [Mikania micrantha]
MENFLRLKEYWSVIKTRLRPEQQSRGEGNEESKETVEFQANVIAYQNLIIQSMYDKQLDSTLLHLYDDVIQQESSGAGDTKCQGLMVQVKMQPVQVKIGNRERPIDDWSGDRTPEIEGSTISSSGLWTSTVTQDIVVESDKQSPVVKPGTLRLLLSLATTSNWSLRQLDINNAFLQAIYGLRQASRAWYNELKSYLLSINFKPTISDPSLFVQTSTSSPIYLLVYVNDIILTGPNPHIVQSLITSLAHRFSLKDLGSLSYFLGVEVIHHTHGLILSQTKYISDLLHKANMSDCKPATTPMSTTVSLISPGDTPLSSSTTYRAIVGSLQYLALTRSDVAFSVNRLSQLMHKPTDAHWVALKRLLRYLQGKIHHGLLIKRNSPLQIHAFTAVDWGGDKSTYRSTSGYIVYLGSNPFSWNSKRQPTLARSSTEAEFRTVASTITELQWFISLMLELGYCSIVTPTIYCDNLRATHYSANPVFHSRMKHLALDFHFVCEKVQDGTIRVTHISGDDQLADVLRGAQIGFFLEPVPVPIGSSSGQQSQYPVPVPGSGFGRVHVEPVSVFPVPVSV